MSSLVYESKSRSGGLPAEEALINPVDELDSVYDIGQLPEPV